MRLTTRPEALPAAMSEEPEIPATWEASSAPRAHHRLLILLAGAAVAASLAFSGAALATAPAADATPAVGSNSAASAASAAATESAAESDAASLYDGHLTDVDVLIAMPALRQYGNYTCGTTCVQMVMNYLFPYDADINLATYEEELGTTEENGTSGDQIYGYLAANEVDVERRDGITMDELVGYLDAGWPVMMCMQAWGESYNLTDPSDTETYLVEGHWVICVGYAKGESGYTFYFNDPACVGHCLMAQDDLEERWIDMDAEGTVYRHFGIVIKGTSDYEADGVFYLG